jgi:hypothetical protein
MATTLTAVAVTALALLLLIPLSTGPVTAVVLVFGMALAGFTVNPVVTALAVRFADDAPTLTSALTTSAYNTGIAAGSALAGTALNTSLGLTGPVWSAPSPPPSPSCRSPHWPSPAPDTKPRSWPSARTRPACWTKPARRCPCGTDPPPGRTLTARLPMGDHT